MRVTKEKAQATRRRIVETAAEQFRDRGFDGIGVADVMKASGLTHGGFYRHFASKDDLQAAATGAAYEQLESDTAGRPIEELLRRYMSDWHRDGLAQGCPTSALGVDAMRQPDHVQAVFAEGVATWLRMIEQALGEDAALDMAGGRAKAIDLATRAVGAIVLARAASSNPSLSDEILRTSLSRALRTACADPEAASKQ